MKFILGLCAIVFMLCGMPAKAGAQEKAHIKLMAMTARNGDIHISLHSSRHFIFANNKYYLHIGNAAFSRYEQQKEGRAGLISFIVSEKEIAQIADGTPIYLTYGMVSRDGSGMDVMSNDSSVPCWSLGVFQASNIRK
jgi:hypothetical protein